MTSLSPNYTRDLLRTRQKPSLKLKALLQHWPSVTRAVDRQRARVTSSIPTHDPLRDGIDLLSPLGRAFDETTHTQALAYLLDPAKPHGFKTDLLIALMERSEGKTTAAGVRAIRHEPTSVRVKAEYRRSAKDRLTDREARCDLWIEIGSPSRRFLVLIENKIDAAEGKEQLARYARQAGIWCANNRAGCLLIYLTKELRPLSPAARQAGWQNLSYLDAAATFRSVWRRRLKAAGRNWLGWYVATLANTAVGLTMECVDQVPLSQLNVYLGINTKNESKSEATRRIA